MLLKDLEVHRQQVILLCFIFYYSYCLCLIDHKSMLQLYFLQNLSHFHNNQNFSIFFITLLSLCVIINISFLACYFHNNHTRSNIFHNYLYEPRNRELGCHICILCRILLFFLKYLLLYQHDFMCFSMSLQLKDYLHPFIELGQCKWRLSRTDLRIGGM